MKSWKNLDMISIRYASIGKILPARQMAEMGVQDEAKRKAFTLAEVLITLGIIGVVAGMTIPILMQNIQDTEMKNKMKKEYSVLSNAYQQLKTESGGDFTYALADGTGANSTILFKNVFKAKLSYIRECSFNTGINSRVCLPNDIKWLNGTTANNSYTTVAYNGATLVLKDGASLAFLPDDLSCNYPRGTYTNECGWILMDVNGLQPPNQWGRDVYLFYVFADVIRPSSSITWGSDDCINTSYGYTCAGKYLLGN